MRGSSNIQECKRNFKKKATLGHVCGSWILREQSFNDGMDLYSSCHIQTLANQISTCTCVVLKR